VKEAISPRSSIHTVVAETTIDEIIPGAAKHLV
jgi:hypothetical protein